MSAVAEEYNVLWEIDFPTFADGPIVTDDGNYFYSINNAYLNVYLSETGEFLHQKEFQNFRFSVWQEYNLSNNKLLIPVSLDSLVIYDLETNIIEDIINLNFQVENLKIEATSLSPNKRFLYMHSKYDGLDHIIIVDMEEKRLYKDLRIYTKVKQLFGTNDPNRMIVITSDQHGTHLEEIVLNDEAPLGYNSNGIESVTGDSEIRGQKYDADENAFYYLSLPKGGHKLIKYSFSIPTKTTLLDWNLMSNVSMWFSDDNSIFASEKGFVRNLQTEESIVFVELPPDGRQHILSSCNGLETILLRDFDSINSHKLKRIDVGNFLTSIEIEDESENYIYPNPTNSFVNINLKCSAKYFDYQISDLNGESVYKSNGVNKSNSLMIDFSPFPRGVYFLTINCKSPKTFKVLKE
jgi:hypothetical protein